MNSILKIVNLSKSFARTIIEQSGLEGEENTFILNDLSLDIPKGKITALIGANGSGKTTLFNIISGFEKPNTGKIEFCNNENVNCKESEESTENNQIFLNNPPINNKNSKINNLKAYEIARAGIGRMFQDVQIFPELTVLENLLVADENNFGLAPFNSLLFRKQNKLVEYQRQEKAKFLFKNIFGPDNNFILKLHEPASNLSYGEQRLIGLARLFMMKNEILLLDEPTSGINSKYIKSSLEFVRLKVEHENLTVLMIEHNIDEVRNYADFCGLLQDGRIVVFDETKKVLNHPLIMDSYFISA